MFLKLNVDGTVFFDLYKAGVDIIVWDVRGKGLLVASIAENTLVSPESI